MACNTNVIRQIDMVVGVPTQKKGVVRGEGNGLAFARAVGDAGMSGDCVILC